MRLLKTNEKKIWVVRRSGSTPWIRSSPTPWTCGSAARGISDYWRLLNPGEYKVIVWAEGYMPFIRRCTVGSDPQPTICDFILTKTPLERIKQIQAKGGKLPRDEQLRIRALRMRRLRVSTKILNRRREQQQQQQQRRNKARRK